MPWFGGGKGNEGKHKHVLSDAEVKEVRKQAAKGKSQEDLAEKYGTTQGSISKIVRGETRGSAGGPVKGKDYR